MANFLSLIAAVDCQLQCAKNMLCSVFQYQKTTQLCILKTGPGANTTDNTMITGPAKCDYIKSKLWPYYL